MLKHRWTDRVCCIVLVVMLLLTGALMGAQSAGLIAGDNAMGYENRLFDQTRVHTIDIVMDDWEGFLENCMGEEYVPCTVVIDGEAYANVGIRAKGNTSLSSVQQYGNDRYSFKIEFDQYSPGGSYYGLDKLSLNNMIQDYTYLKDYMTYTMMNKMGVAAPLCSFAQISINGEAWGLYLAAEAVEDSFLRRNYGTDSGDLYKPDSMSFGGGRGNGRDFDMDAFAEKFTEAVESGEIELPEGVTEEDVQQFAERMENSDPSQMGGMAPGEMPEGFDPSQMGGMMQMPGDFDPAQMGGMTPPEGFDPAQMGDAAGAAAQSDDSDSDAAQAGGMTPPEGFDPAQMGDTAGEAAQSDDGDSDAAQAGDMTPPEGFDPAQMGDAAPQDEAAESEAGDDSGDEAAGESARASRMNRGGMGFGGGGGMGSDDVKLVYTDDDPSSYSNIFDNAKTTVTEEDQARLIAALKAMNEGDTSAVDTDAVMRYLAVHNFVCNGDSYTGSMVHNYYLYEDDGVLSMIPWDYNLAMGAFSMGGGMGSSGATGTVNSPIDSPVSDGDVSSRPMVAWIFDDQETIDRYHAVYDEFIATVFESGWFEETVTFVSELIAPYVEADPTKFCTYEQFTTGVEALKQFGALRAQSVRGQLEGTIPSTSDGQQQDSSALIDASDLSLNDMGEFNQGGGMGGDRGDMGNRGFGRGGQGAGEAAEAPAEPEAAETTAEPEAATESAEAEATVAPAMDQMSGSMTPPDMGNMSGGMTPPDMGSMPAMGQMPGGMTPPDMGGAAPQMPGN